MKLVFGKMKYFVLGILMVAFFVLPLTFGASEKIVMGQYDVSFDLNTPLKYTIESQSPIVSNNGTNYSATIIFTNQTQILMGIDISKTPKDSTIGPEERYVSALARKDKNATVTTRTIDNELGVLTTSVSKSGIPTFTFSYWLDSKKCDCGDVFAGTARLKMVGVAPRNITENLLNTLHVTSSTNTSVPAQTTVPVRKITELTGTQGASIAKQNQLQPLSSLSVGGDDPAYAELTNWAG